MRKLIYISLIFYTLSLFNAVGQTPPEGEQTYATDTTEIQELYWLTPEETLITTDTIVEAQEGFITDTTDTKKWKPNPDKAVWWGAIVPGMGQIMNKKYWKLPIFYAGFMGGAFAITYCSERSNTYSVALSDIIDNDESTNSFLSLLPTGTDYTGTQNEINQLTNQLRSRKDNFRRYRDLSIVITIVWYGISILEAYVDAQLYDFDISPDLSLRVQPTIIRNDLCIINQHGYSTPVSPIGKDNAIGLQFSFTIK